MLLFHFLNELNLLDSSLIFLFFLRNGNILQFSQIWRLHMFDGWGGHFCRVSCFLWEGIFLNRLKLVRIKTGSTSHRLLWIVPVQVRRAAGRSVRRREPARPSVRSGGRELRRPAAAASLPASVSPARPPAVSWPWPCGFETRSWLVSLWGWESSRTPLSPRWTGTVSDGTSSPGRAAARSWRGSWVFCCSCVFVGCTQLDWGVLGVWYIKNRSF